MIEASKMREIRDLIGAPQKWIQGAFNDEYWELDGEFAVGHVASAYCIDGAVVKVMPSTAEGAIEVRDYEKFIAGIMEEMFPTFLTDKFPNSTPEELIHCCDSNADKIFAFNDCKNRTWEEVFSVMDKAVVRAEEMEGL